MIEEIISYFPITNPTHIFLVVLLIILSAPIIMGKLRIPHIIGMVLAGVLIGPYGFNILVRDDSFEIFGKVGMYYIMFLAALEMDAESVKRRKNQIGIFGFLTFIIPFVMTYVAGIYLLDYTPQASLLLSCIMSANTLIAYPIVIRYGLQKKPSVSLSVGSSMISLFISLVVVAILVNSLRGSSTIWFWLWFVLRLILFIAGSIILVPRLTKWFLHRYSDQIMQFIFILGMMFLCASVAEMVGLEGILGAFIAGLILNRYIPKVSALMNRIEFIGNALFIPYFLIGVGMIIDVRLLFSGRHILYVVAIIVIIGTLAKAIAAYLSCILFGLPKSSGHMMFGLTSAHAAGGIAMVMVGMTLQDGNGNILVTTDMLNGVVIMILFTCIISSIITEKSAQQIVLRDKDFQQDEKNMHDDEKILMPVKYPEYASTLVNVAIMMRNPELGRGLIALHVVYDDEDTRVNQNKGRQLLEQVQRTAAAADVKVQTQVRLAANIANGIRHAFKEYNASEIVMGLHQHPETGENFWGAFAQSLYNGLNRQIILVRLHRHVSNISRIQVAVPSRAQFEPGFYRWMERISRLTANIGCKIQFHGRKDTLELINEFVQNRHPEVRAEYTEMEHWNGLPNLAQSIEEDHLFIVVTARKGTISYKSALDRLPEELTQHFSGKNLMIIYPDQYGDDKESMTFAASQHTEEKSAYKGIREFLKKHNIRKYFKRYDNDK